MLKSLIEKNNYFSVAIGRIEPGPKSETIDKELSL